MGRNEQVLSLIGLCLRGRNLEVGEEPVEAVSRARDARVILLASDAAENTARRVQRFAETGQCVWLRVPFTKRELGQATGRGSAAVAAVTDIGLAVAVARRLAELDPEKLLTPAISFEPSKQTSISTVSVPNAAKTASFINFMTAC